MRIATDLHDDIGGTLSRIAILSEVVKRQPGLAPDAQRRLDDLGETARGLVDAASDVVWSVDPRRDDVASVLQRVRDHASDVLDGASLTLTTSPDPAAIRLSPDQRRHLYLILKEAVTNVAKHAAARHATLRVATDGHRLRCELQDDGRGFQRPTGRGNGLGNMRTRAAAMGGHLTIDSGANGTTLHLELPLTRRPGLKLYWSLTAWRGNMTVARKAQVASRPYSPTGTT
jgi:signal transduction histidine kinase